MRRRALALIAVVALSGCQDKPGTTTASPAPSVTNPASVAASPEPVVAVPAGALLSPADLGQGWSAGMAVLAPCVPTAMTGAHRSQGFTQSRGRLTETVTRGWEVPQAVGAWRQALQRCRFAVEDLALGDAGLVARKADHAVVVTGTEGVVVVLHAQGALAGAREELEGWADLAFGTSCVAAPDGCH